ncbi:MAG: helix-turn-helix transcriptional regulator [Thiotrichaceae bacterium]
MNSSRIMINNQQLKQVFSPIRQLFYLVRQAIMDSNSLKKQIGRKIEQIRTVKGWSRGQVADKIGMSIAGYGSIERGEIDIQITRLAQLAEIFEITLSDLLGITEKNVFNFTGTHNKACHNWQVNSPPSELKELILRQELEKSELIQQSQQKEIEHLQREISRLEEINHLLKEQR